MTDFDARAHLRRPDKWYLGAGDRLTWTPPHPQWLDVPGFWDEAHYYDLSLAPVFTVTLLAADGTELPLRATGRDWRPDRLRQTYDVPETPLQVTERRTAHGNDVLGSTFAVENAGDDKYPVRLVVWTLQPSGAADTPGPLTDLSAEEEQLRFVRPLQSDDRPTYDVGCVLGLSRPVTAQSVVPSESGPDQPHWAYTPFYETSGPNTLGPSPSTADLHAPVVYLGLETHVRVAPDDTETVSAAFGTASTPTQAGKQVTDVLDDDPPARSAALWENYFADLPSFECSDPHLQRYYWSTSASRMSLFGTTRSGSREQPTGSRSGSMANRKPNALSAPLLLSPSTPFRSKASSHTPSIGLSPPLPCAARGEHRLDRAEQGPGPSPVLPAGRTSAPTPTTSLTRWSRCWGTSSTGPGARCSSKPGPSSFP